MTPWPARRVVASSPHRPSASRRPSRQHRCRGPRTGDVQDLIKACQEKGFEKFVLRAQYDETR
jgi:hypothetical protein